MDTLKNAYVYGIYIDDTLVYVGQTTQPILDRIDEHIQRCHNKELKEALLTNHYTFKILYESHDTIDQATLNNIEEALITTNLPKYNKCGVTMPYNSYNQKTAFNGGGIATLLAQKHYYSEVDIQQLLQQNAQISCVYICLKNEYASFFFTPAFSDLSQKEQEESIQYAFGKVNKHNQMTSQGFKGFRQSSYCVKESDGTLRFPSIEEKVKGIPKDQITKCHLVFIFKTPEEYEENFDKLLKKDIEISKTLSEEDSLNYWIWSSMETARLTEAKENSAKNIYKYYPLEITSLQGQKNLKDTYYYIDTWQTSSQI